jgi:hypothetical protein
VVVRGRGDEASEAASFTLFAQPGELTLMESEGQGADAVVRLAPITRASLGALVEDLLEKHDDE